MIPEGDTLMKTIPTVTGAIATREFGFTLSHEHVFVHDEGVIASFPHIWNRKQAIESARNKLQAAYDAGVRTIIDMSIMGNGRDIHTVRAVAEGLPINILVATGAFYPDQLPRYFHTQPLSALRECFVHDIKTGISGTSVRAAIIKVCTDAPGLTPDVEKTLRAAAQASLETGVPIHTHARAENQSGLLQMRVFLEEGVPPERIYIGHVMDDTGLDYAKRLLDLGVYIGFDRFASAAITSTKIQTALSNLADLCGEGYSKQILLGNDGCSYQTVVRTGDSQKDPSLLGNDYTILPSKILPLLREAGVSDAYIQTMAVENPIRLFSLRL